MAHKKWVLREADRALANDLSEKFNMDPFIAYLLVARGINSELAFSDFISQSVKLVSPFEFKDMKEAVFAIKAAIKSNEKICIFGDYDCDGVTSTAILLMFLKKQGAEVFHYIPSREGEGYGLNKNAIDERRCEIVEGSVSDLPFEDNTFDIVTAFESVYFWPDFTNDLKEVRRVLKDRGKIFIANEAVRIKDDERQKEFCKLLDANIYSKDELYDALTQAGFSDIISHEKYSKDSFTGDVANWIWVTNVCR